MVTSAPVRVSIVVRCYNEAQHIGRLLTGIMRQSVHDLEVVIVDSGSTDETVSIASQFPIKLVTIEPQDFSFGYALNLGCEASRGEFLVFASAHVYAIRNDWIERMIEPFSDSKTGLVYGRQIGDDVTKYSERQIFSTWFPDVSVANQGHYFCNNANAAIRRTLWSELRYDETLTGLEDLDMARRLQAAGHRIAYQANASIVHVHDESYRQIYNRYRREAMALKRILPEHQFNFLDFFQLFFANMIADLRHAMKEHRLAGNVISIGRFRLMQFWGTYRGSNSRPLASAELRQRFYYPNELTRKGHSIGDDRDPAVIDYTAPDN